MIRLTEEQTAQFITFVKQLHAQNWGLWPDASEWPEFGTDYTAYQEGSGSRHVTVVKFDDQVRPFGFRLASRKWAAGPGGRRMKDTAGLGF